MAVTLINVLSVPKGKEDEFVRVWEDIKRDITKNWIHRGKVSQEHQDG